MEGRAGDLSVGGLEELSSGSEMVCGFEVLCCEKLSVGMVLFGID